MKTRKAKSVGQPLLSLKATLLLKPNEKETRSQSETKTLQAMIGAGLSSVLKISRNPKIDLTRMNKNSDLEQDLAKPPENHALTFVRDEHLFYLNRVPV